MPLIGQSFSITDPMAVSFGLPMPTVATCNTATTTVGEHLMSAEYSDSRTITYAYASGNVAVQEHALTEAASCCGARQYYEYDELGRLSKTYRNNGEEAYTFAYDTAGKISVRNGMGELTQLYFDHRDRLVRLHNDSGGGQRERRRIQ